MLHKREQKVMNFLRRQAIDVTPVGSAKIAAAVSFRNEVISLGHCQRRTHPFQAKYSKNPEAIYLHAETNAISNALNHLRRNDLERATLHIYRVKRPAKDSNEFVDGLAKPCEGCMRAIVAFGFKKIVYTTDITGEYSIIERNSFICG